MKEIEMSPFRKKAVRMMQMVPKGRVASYAQIADLAGKPNGPREVAWLLHGIGKGVVPWQRIVGSSGRIMFPKRRKEFREQILLLRREGVEVTDEGRIDLEKYRWKKQVRRRSSTSKPTMFSTRY
jgi:methylated-DNA-protein-cysteine methyltransferase-like protein